MDYRQIADCINILGEFCGKRDLPALTRSALEKRISTPQADLLILFGGSIPQGCLEAGHAMQQQLAKRLLLVGGEGHTTESLRQKLHAACPELETAGRPEADIMADYLALRYGITDCLRETASTNCGNNVTYALELLRQRSICPKTVILIQDATMQRRMEAGFQKQVPSGEMLFLNYAAYHAEVTVRDGQLAFVQEDIWGMWEMERYLSLLLGEIPRLRDDENGYGPNGKGFIAHVDIPPAVEEAFAILQQEFGGLVRKANPKYASKE